MSCGCSWKRKPQAVISRCSKCSLLPTEAWRPKMKPKARRRSPRLPRIYSEEQLAGIKQSTTARRLATVERLQTAIDALKEKKREISVQTIYDECGLRYAAIHRNPEALALFRANSTRLVAARKRHKRNPYVDEEATPEPRDPLLSYTKAQLVTHLRSAQRQLQEVRQQQSALVE